MGHITGLIRNDFASTENDLGGKILNYIKIMDISNLVCIKAKGAGEGNE